MARGVHGSGRTQMIREFLSKHCNEAFNAREVRDAVEPGASVDVFGATLAGMAGRGEVARMGAGKGRVHFFWPRGMERLDGRKARKQTKPLQAQVVRRATAPAPVRNPKPRRTTPAPRALADTLRTPPRRVQTNFPAALATVDHGFDPRRAASHRIAADVAAFERNGGQVQRLGVTPLFTPLEPTVFDQEQP